LKTQFEFISLAFAFSETNFY